jgi:Carboxypeptidase regulatory-like domain
VTGTIGGRVLRGAVPEAGARVMVAGSSPAHRDLGQLTGAAGQFRFAGLEPGFYTLAAYAADGARGEASVAVADGADAVLDIELGGAP